MAKAIISSILEGQLGKYVDGLRSDSLVVGLWSGELELRDLALKPHALAELQLPVAVASGSVSRVLVRVPWNQLGSASVTITLEGVSALVVPNTALPSNAELLQAKHNHMERRELLRQHRRFAARVVPGERTTDKNAKVEDEGTFVSRLTAKIVANLQVTLLDVHLRYEDVVANPETPFACGVMLERFRLFTTDGEGREAYVDQTTLHNAFTYKKAELTQFGVYWDRLNPKDPCARLEALEEVPRLMRSMVQNAEAETDQGADTRRRWLLRPCSLGVQLTKNESTDYSTVAKYVVEANLGELQGSLSREQYEDALFLQRAFLGRRAVEAHFALSRGRPLHTPGARPCEWWDYATRLVLEQRRAKLPRTAQNDKDKDVVTHTHRRRPHQRKMRWSSVHKALLEQQLYVEAFRAQLRNGGSLDPTTRQAKFKRRYEDIYPIDVVLVLRDAAEDAEDREREEAKASAPAKTQTTSNGGGSWYSYFFGSDSSASAPPAEEGEDPVLSAEGRENLREAYNDAVEKASRAHEVPMGCNLVAVDLQLANGSIALFQSNDHERPFMTAMLNGSLMLNIQPEDEWDAQFRVQHFDIFNGLAQDARFRSFCSPSRVSSPEGDSRLPCASIDLSRRAVVHSQIQTDDDVEARLKVRVRTEPVRVMVDPSFVMFLHAFFVSLLPEKQLEKVWQFATSSVADWMFPDDTGDERNKQESLGTAIISHERKEAEEAELMRSLERAQGRVEYDVLVDMDAPVLIVPDSVNDRADAVLVVDLGMLSFRNEEEVTMIDTALDVTLTTPDEDSRRLHWLLDVSNIHVLLGHQQQLVTWSDKELRGFAKIVEEVSVKFSVYTQASSSRLKLPLRDENKAAAKPLPQVGIYASVPVITVSLSEEQLVALGHIHSSVLVQAAIVAKENDQRLDYFEDQEQESKNESATAFDSIDADEASSVSIAVGEKFMLEVQLSLGCVELNLRESVVKDAFVVRALQTSFTLAAFSAHQKFQARLKALVMEDKLYSSESRFSKLICTGEGEGDIPHLIAIDVTSFAPETNSPEQQRFGGTASQVEVDVQFNVLHLQWNPSSVALFYRIVSAYASAIQSHEDDFPPVDSTAAQNPALETVKHQEVSRDEQTERAIALPSLSSRGRPFMTIRASLVQFSLTFNKDQLDRQLARLEMTDAAINFTNYDVEGRNSSSEDTFEVTGHIGNFVGMDLSTAKHPLYSMLIGLDEDEARRRKSACNSSEALLTFAFVSDPMASDKSSLRLAFQPVRGVYYHQQILELVDFLLEGVGGAIVSQTLMNATQMLLREDEASVVLDLTIEKPTLILPFSLEDSPHAKVTADVLRLEHFPASAVHYEGPPGARTKRVVHDEFLSRTMIQRADAEGGGISMRVDCKDIFLKQVRIYCTAAGAGKQMKGDSERPMYEELLSDPANLKISIEDLVSSTVSLGDEEETDGSDETRMVFLPRITVNSVLPPVEARLSRTAYLGIVALILENFGADELQNAPGAEDINRSNSVGRLLARKNSADTGDLPSLRPKVTYTYRQPDADVATLRMRFVMENARILLLQDVVAGQFPEEIASPESIVNRVLTTPAIDESLHNGAFAEVVASGFSLLFADEYDKNPCLTVTLNGFCARDLANKHKSAMGSVDSSKLLVSPRPLDICYTWDDAALTGDLDLLFSEVAVTVVPKALLALVDFFTLPSRPNSAAVHKSTRVKNLIAPANVVRTTSQPTSPSPSPSLLTRRESISDILRDGKEPETTITVRMNATQVGIAVPRDAYDPDTPRVAFTGDFGLEFKWKPRPDAEKANASGGDLEIQSSILADAQNMEVVLENAKRSGCCVASPSLNEQWDAIDVAPVIQLLEPCNLHVEVSDLFPHAGQRQQIVALSFSPIEVFVSYDDACMAIDTMQAIDEAFAQHESHHHAASLRYSPSVDSTVPSVLLRSRSSSKSIQEYGAAEEEEVHRYFTCELPSVSLTLINDCGGCDMGLAQLQVERSHLFLNVTYTIQHGDSDDLSASFVTSDFPISTRPMTTSISGGGSLVVVMAYYNPDTRDWHPMCAEWSIDASIQGSISHESELHVIVTASQPLDLTLTHGLLEVVASVGGAWKRRTALIVGTEQEDSKRLETAPCVIRNETGLPLGFWLTNGSFTTAPEVVSTGQLADLRYVHGVGRGRGVVRRYASADRATANLRLCLQLMHSKNTDGDVPRFQAVQGLIFEQLGARAFPLVDTHGQRTSFTMSLSAQLVEGRILLVVASPIKLVNRLSTSRPVALLVNDPTWLTPVEIGILQPNQDSAVPILLSLASELRVRPVGAGPTYSWSAPIPVQTRSAVELKVESAVASTSVSRERNDAEGRNAVYCVSMSSVKELRVVEFAEPLVLVNKLPVPITFRARSAYSSAYGSGASDSPSKPEMIAVGAKTSIWWTDIAQRPLFQLLVEGCTSSSKWLELAPRGTSNGAVLSVQLTRIDDGRPFRILLRVVGSTEHTARPVRIEIMAEIWVINRSGLDLVYGTAADSEAYIPPRAARAQVGNAQISAYSSDSGKVPVIRIGLRGCNWSGRFEADPRRLSWQDECITLRSAGSNASSGSANDVLYELGVSADYATRHFGSVTTLVSVIPRYLVLNHSRHTLLLLEAPTRQQQQLNDSSIDNIAHHVLAAGDTYALYWVGGARTRLRASLLPDDGASDMFCSDGYDWSAPFSVDQMATTDLLVPPRSSGRGVHLEVEVKRGSFSQATFVIVVTEGGTGFPTSTSSRLSISSSTVSSFARDGAPGHVTTEWQIFSLHAQVAGVIVTVTDRKHSGMSADDSQGLFAERAEDESELVARATLTRIGLEASWSPQATSAKVNLMGLKVEDLLPQSKNRVILRPLLHGDSLIPAARPGAVGVEKYFLEITYLERPHAKYTWVERVHVELQNVKIATSMTFVDRLTKLQRETIAHFQHTSLVAAFPGEEVSDIEDNEEENLLAYFVDQSHDEKGINSHDISAMTGRKMYIVSGEISPVRVIVSFTRDKSDANHRSSDGFWLSNLKLKIENACVALEGYRLSNALATQEALGGAIIRFYEHSVKSQAFSLIESIEVTSLVTSMVAGGVTTLVSTLRGKADPAAAVGATAPGIATPNVDDSSSDAAFRYEHMTNGEIIRKHSRAFSECHNSTEFLRQVRHLVYDWDANHTGLGARGCVALALINNSRHSLVVNTQLNDGASLRVLPLGRRHLASVLDSVPDGEAASAGGGGTTSWRADRALVVFAYGYTPTLLTSGDVYFTVQSNACSVYATRKTARLRANRGYTATFTLQETQSWWSTNVIIVGDDLQANDASPASSDPNSLFGEVPDPDDQSADMQDEDDEFEVQFSSSSLGIIAKQSGHSVIVRECVPSSAAHSSGRIAAGDCILAVNGTRVDNTSQFKTLVSKAPRPIVLRFRATGRHSNAAYDLFGEHKS